ncbi:hypothetical protein EV670_1961 [Rivibacter subsaxonicus]|uniref:histidine kinase n=2 Tax=Rivibacter subsaxonicus TaxID=457575 RepID=A0A4Q7VXG5_9BURK|nr:hypothetical protein EV670_1961 [Rivibacter subsaxonicus]
MAPLPAWLGLLALLAALAGCLGATEPATSLRITTAELIEPGAAPKPVTLPDEWEHSAPERDGAVRYRIEIPDAALHGEASGMFTRRAGMSLRVSLNGRPFASIGDFDRRPLPDMSQEPLLVPLPSALLQPRGNVIEIELHGERRRESGLSDLWFGPLAELRPMHARAQRDRVHSAYAVSAAATVMGLLALLLAVRMRRLTYAYFGVASLLWAWRVSLLTPPTSAPGSALGPALGPALETIFFYVSYPWFVSLMTLYALASIGRETPRVRRWVAAWSVAALLLIVLNWSFNLPLLRTLVSVGMLLMVVALMIQLFDAAWRERSQPAILLSVAALLAFGAGLRDFYVFRIAWDYGALTWSRYTILVLLGVLAWMLVDEFTRSTLALRSLNRDLADRVARKERELHLVFEGQRKRDREQATRAERDRILREMHDGLGGRLVAALALAQQVQPGGAVVDPESDPEAAETAQAHAHEAWGELKSTLDDCLVELRLALDSLEVEQRPLVEALAELRFRIEPSLRAAGVRLVWQPSELLSGAEFGAGDTLQVLRIVREALTNVIKHAQASVVWLRLEPVIDGDVEPATPRALRLSVIDNGLAQRTQQLGEALPLFVPGALGRGRGLANMERRAAAVGASFSSGPQAEGWCVQLELPLPPAATAD